MDSMNDDNYIRVYIWMRKLKLTLSETLVYALVYGFTNCKLGKYVGTYDDISKLLNISPKTVERAMESLLKKRLIMRKEWHINGYCVTYQYWSVTRQNDASDTRQNDVLSTRQNDASGTRQNDVTYSKEKYLKKNMSGVNDKAKKKSFCNCTERQYIDYLELEKVLIEK